MSTAAVAEVSAYRPPVTERVWRGWIESPPFDLLCFVLSPLLGLAFLGVVLWVPPGQALAVQATVFYFVAVPHYMSTYTFFFGDDNRSYYRTRRLAFYGGPILIAGSVLLLWELGFPPIVMAAVFTWNVWHVARQNAGILSIYRRLNGGDRREARPAQLSILGVSGAMAFWFADRYPPIGVPLARIHPHAAKFLSLALLAMGIGAGIVLVRRIAMRQRPPAAQEMVFLGASVVMFHPYLWIKDYTVATMGMLIAHFVQYLAIVWVLHRRKYGEGHQGSPRQQILGRVSARRGLIACFAVASGLFFFGSNHITAAMGVPSVYAISWFAFTFIHFYLDGLIWAFREPFVRESVGAYLMPAARIVTTES